MSVTLTLALVICIPAYMLMAYILYIEKPRGDKNLEAQ